MQKERIVSYIVGRLMLGAKQIYSARYKTFNRSFYRATGTALVLALLLSPIAHVFSQSMTSPSYRLEPNAADSFGGFSESGSYQLLDSGGEAAIGLGDSGSYKLGSGYIEQLEQSIELNVLPDGLVAYYPLNTGAGVRAYDATSNNNHGTFEGSPDWVEGKVGGGALEFDGASDYIDAGTSASMSNLSELTWQAWIYPTNVSKDQMFISKQSADYFRLLNGRPHLSLRVGGSQETLHASTNLSNDTWYHLVATYDGSAMKIYVNGQLDREESLGGGSLSLNSGDLEIGHWSTADPRGFEGQIDEVKFYDRALSEDEVLDEHLAAQQGVANALTLPRIGASQSLSVSADAVIATDAPGYSLSISQDGNLRTEDGDEIAAISSSIDFPAPWSEGSTTGFGFSVAEAVQRDGKWGSSPNFEYAAIPENTTTFHSRTGLSGGVKETAELSFRLGVDGAQTAGIYRNRLGFTATMKP